MNRTLNVIRMQLVNRMTFIWLPLIILGASFAMSLLIYALIPVSAPKYGGGSQAPLWYFFAVGLQALTLTFPFSQAMSVTRKAFYVGSLLTAILTSLILGAVFVVGGLIEEATGGWGMNGFFFRLPWVWEGGPAVAGLFFFTVALLFFVIGFWSATIYKRFGGLGLTIVLVGIGLVLIGLVALVGWVNAWTAVFGWIGAAGALGLTLWGLVLVAVLAGVSYLTLRRMVP